MGESMDRDPLLVGLDQVGDGIDALKRDNAALRAALTRLVDVFDWGAVHVEAGGKDAIKELAEAFAQARAALQKAGAL